MPYLSEKQKKALTARHPVTVGELTYTIQQALRRYLDDKSEVRFEDLADCLGALDAAKYDFEHRKLRPYELLKLKEHGDVW